jgi:thiol-disulfide isomerase/thioredoxin
MKQRLLPMLLTIAFCFSLSVNAQLKKIPPFRMIQADGNLFKAEQLPLGKPVLLVYFSPECDHCEKLMQDFFKMSKEFQKASVAFITYVPVDKVAKFDKDYGVKKFTNIYSGTEGTTFFVRNYFKLTEMPFVALYKKNGDLVTSYTRDIALQELAQKLRQLQ